MDRIAQLNIVLENQLKKLAEAERIYDEAEMARWQFAEEAVEQKEYGKGPWYESRMQARARWLAVIRACSEIDKTRLAIFKQEFCNRIDEMNILEIQDVRRIVHSYMHLDMGLLVKQPIRPPPDTTCLGGDGSEANVLWVRNKAVIREKLSETELTLGCKKKEKKEEEKKPVEIPPFLRGITPNPNIRFEGYVAFSGPR